MRTVLLVMVASVFLAGCATEVAVMTLDAAIRDGARVAKNASQGAAESITIEVQATNGFTVGAKVPMLVVPISAESNISTTTKYTIKVDLSKYPTRNRDAELLELRESGLNRIYILDTDTGILRESK